MNDTEQLIHDLWVAALEEGLNRGPRAFGEISPELFQSFLDRTAAAKNALREAFAARA